MYLLVVDSHPKWLEVEPLSSMDSIQVIYCLARLFATHGLPDVLVSDNGPSFDSKQFHMFCMANKIKFLRIASYHPASNGQVEKLVHTTKQALRAMMPDKWGIALSRFLLNYRLTPHSATAFSPAEILLRRRPKSLLDNLHTDLWTSAVKAQEEDATNLAGRDNQKLVIQSFKVGDRDCARDFQAHSTAKWTTGIVQEVISPRSYWVELPQLDLRWHRSTDHLRSRGNGGPTEDADSERRTVVKVLRPEAVSSDIPAKELEPESHEPCSEEKESEAPCLLRTQLASPGPTTASPREVIEQRPALQERPARNRHPPRYLEDYVV
ncbi:hypothetical protein M514_20789 [Trichuris suis]|uniref:Integrase catalytic domain-containing protein n=1 Tax=Trichuris suis TaxID=68888 RepID=A0A085NBS7_9BILA|nr:hypothetical protein M514_20789 [Trichuris suis]